MKFLAVAGAATLALAGCDDGGGTATNQSSKVRDVTSFRACTASDTGGWDGKSFSESAYEDLKASQMSLGVQINTAKSNSDTDFNLNVEFMASNGCNLVIGIGFNLEEAVYTSAGENRDVHYALVDPSFNDDNNNTVALNNTRLLLFSTAKAAYLVGHVAAGMTKTGKVTTFGGIQIPSVTVFIDGFASGVATYDKAKGTNVQLLGWDKIMQNGSFMQSFDDQTLDREQAQQFISQGANIIMPVTGPVGPGAAAAAKADRDTWIIGVDSDWYGTNPDYSPIILTSVMREIGASVEQATQDSANGKFGSTPYVGTLANGGVSIALFHDFDNEVSAGLRADPTKPTDDIEFGKLVIESQNAPK